MNYNFRDLIKKYCTLYQNNTFYNSNIVEKKISYEHLQKFVQKFNTFLVKKKINKKQKILVIFENSKLLTLLYMSIIANNRIFVPVNPDIGPEELKYIIKKTEPRALFCDASFKKKFTNAIKTIKEKVLISNSENFIQKIFLLNEKIISPYPSSNIAQILFTSGSTGNPKGVVLTHSSIYENLIAIKKILNINLNKPKFMAVTPLYHNNGQFIPTLLPLILGGSTIAVNSKSSLLFFWDWIKLYKINYTSLMATHINYFNSLKKKNKYELKSVFCGGAKLDKTSHKIFEKKFKINVFCNYGLTETSSIAASEGPSGRKKGTVGKPLFNNIIIIKNKRVNGYGEILIKGKNLFKSYLGNSKLTKQKFYNGFFKTGDLGKFDSQGFLHIKDRLDNMIIVSGENIYPSDIENQIINFKGIKAGVVASIKDPVTQNKLIFIYESNKIITYEVFYKFLETKISKFKIPKKIYRCDQVQLNEIPKAANKKILRSKLKIYINKNIHLFK